MTAEERLRFLTELRSLREGAGLTQPMVALRYFGMNGSQSYKAFGGWENGKAPPSRRRRASFIDYLWSGLGLRRDTKRFEEFWETLCEAWHWEPLTPDERKKLRLSSIPSTETKQPGSEEVSFRRMLSEQIRQNHDTVNVEELEVAIGKYLEWLVFNNSHIEMRIEKRNKQVRLPLENAYVPLSAEVIGEDRAKEFRPINLDEILGVGEQLVVKGGPGSGKSTVLQYITWVLASALLKNDSQWAEEMLGLKLADGDLFLPLPIPIPLSVYARMSFATENQSTLLSFPEFIQHYFHQNNTIIEGLPNNFFQRILKSKRSVILLLDGLDEIADENLREKVVQELQKIAGHRQIRTVVTCRSVAYKGSITFTRGFRQISVNPLSPDEVERLVRKAYEQIYVEYPAERDEQTQALLTGIDGLEEQHGRRLNQDQEQLINSPLMVRMLLIVHLNDGQLPKDRADLYKRFVATMIASEHVADRLDRGLGKFYGDYSEPLMSHLAFEMHRKGRDQGREIDIDTLRSLLRSKYEKESGDFIRLIHLRGSLVEERDNLYRFIHLAFQEYLAARYLAEHYWRKVGTDNLLHFLAQQTPHSWWREVVILLPGYLRSGKPLEAETIIKGLAALEDEWRILAADWSPDEQLAAAEIAATATLEWFPEDEALKDSLRERIVSFFRNPQLLNQVQPAIRALAGDALADLGDPRFNANTWFLPNDEMLGFIEIPAGKFIMGEGNEQHELTLPTFYISRFPITVAQFRAAGIEPDDERAFADPDNHPVCWITWYQAVEYCNWLDKTLRDSDQTPPALAEKLRQGWKITLPSEAEWEKTARGTNGQIYPWQGDEIEPTLANYRETGIGSSSTVGCFPAGASPYGVEEMSGNVWEWTRSRYLDYPYPSDEKGIQKRENLQKDDRKRRVLRGGAFYNSESNVRCAYRDYYYPYFRLDNVGFRVVASPFTSGL